MACEGYKTAKLIVSSDSQVVTINFNTAPIYVSCKGDKVAQCEIFIVTYRVTAVYNGIPQIETRSARRWGPMLGIKNSAFTVEMKNNGNPDYNGCSSSSVPAWGLVLSDSSGPYVPGSAVITSVVNVTKPSPPSQKGQGILVKDKYDNILFSDDTLTCNWQIICGDDCPAGTIKCCSNNYPGYCCVPCGEVKGRIDALIASFKNLTS
jgi:hypothetical protein